MVIENRERNAKWAEQDAKWAEQDAKWDKRFGFIGESLERLANIAQLHQHRLDSHEDRLDELEGTA